MEAKLIKIENKIELTANAKTELEKSFKPFIEKSVSAETRRAYGRVVKEFSRFQKYTEPLPMPFSMKSEPGSRVRSMRFIRFFTWMRFRSK
jgi:hypothetical protein